MNKELAYRIIFSLDENNLSEDEGILYLEVLNYLVKVDSCRWEFQLASYYEDSGCYELALKYFKQDLERGELAYLGIGDVYLKMHEYDLAKENYQKALEAGYPKAKKRLTELERGIQWI